MLLRDVSLKNAVRQSDNNEYQKNYGRSNAEQDKIESRENTGGEI